MRPAGVIGRPRLEMSVAYVSYERFDHAVWLSGRVA